LLAGQAKKNWATELVNKKPQGWGAPVAEKSQSKK